jgi:transcriptional regulator with XRE-family HTH domain
MAKWSDIREKHLSDPEVAEEYEKLPPVELVAQIIKARKTRGLTQEDLARMIGTKQPAIARIESGKYLGCSIGTLLKIAEALDMSLTISPRRKIRFNTSTPENSQGGSQRKATEA